MRLEQAKQFGTPLLAPHPSVRHALAILHRQRVREFYITDLRFIVIGIIRLRKGVGGVHKQRERDRGKQ
jgi:hypothetical protein